MKYIFLIFSIFFTLTSNAQLPQSGEHLYHPNMDNFVGTWKWISGNDVFTFKLKKVHLYYPAHGYYDDMIMGSHCYIKNGIIIEDNLADFPSVGQNLKGSIYIWYHNSNNTPNNIYGQVKDPLNNKSERLYLEFLPAATPTLHWTLESLGGGNSYLIGTTPIKGIGWTLPADIILVKQP